MDECSDLFVIASRSCGVAIQGPPEPILDRASPGLPRRYAPRNDEQKGQSKGPLVQDRAYGDEGMVGKGEMAMWPRKSDIPRVAVVLLCLLAASPMPLCSVAAAQSEYVVEPVAERRLDRLPPGLLYWTVEGFPSQAQAQAAAGPTSLAAEVAGLAWLFTLDQDGAAGHGGTLAAKAGPVPPVNAREYLMRINHAGGPLGASTPIHMHPGSESFFVLSGRLSQRTSQGTMSVAAGGGNVRPLARTTDGGVQQRNGGAERAGHVRYGRREAVFGGCDT